MDVSRYWREICHAIQEGVFLVDPSGRIVMANEAMSRLTGYSRQELVGKSCRIFGCEACKAGSGHRSSSDPASGDTGSVSAPGSGQGPSSGSGHGSGQASGEGSGAHWCPLFAGRDSRPKRCAIVRKDGSRVPVFKNQSLLRDESGAVIGAVESVTDLSELDRLDRRVEELTTILDEPRGFHGLLGRSPAMRRLFELLEKAARARSPVLLLGESGTGKELAAQAIHDLGPRSKGPFVRLNCAALSESLLESELFGHARGAFTGAHRARRGRFEEAHGGDIFLDEIGDAPLSIQVKLLRVLETGTVERVGENRPVPADARVIAATRQDLRALMAGGRFREDFYFRVSAIPVELPPLRARMEDLPLLADHFLRLAAARAGVPASHLTPEAMRLLMGHAWPGNVRELKSAMEYAVMLADGERIGPEHLPPGVGPGGGSLFPAWPVTGRAGADAQAFPGRVGCEDFARGPGNGPGGGPDQGVEGVASAPSGHGEGGQPGPMNERDALIDALRQAGGNKTKAASILGVTRLTVHNRMRKHGVVCERNVRG